MLEWAKLGLAAFEEGQPVPLQAAVEAGQRTAAQTVMDAPRLAEHRRPTLEEQDGNKGDNGTFNRGSNSAPYLAARLKRDAPEIAERLAKAGKGFFSPSGWG